MSNGFDVDIKKESSNIRKEVQRVESAEDQKWKTIPLEDRARKVIDIKARHFHLEAYRRGEEITFDKARRMAVEVAEYHDQRFA